MATRSATLQILSYGGPVEENSYIVKLRSGTDKLAHLDHISSHISPLEGLSEVTHPHWSSDCFHGYAGKFSHASLDALLLHPDIEYVEENVITSECAVTTETDAPWGLARVCQTNKLNGSESSLTYSYTYDDTAGKGVDIYVFDSGVYIDHHDFEGRATWGTTLLGAPNVDYRGHGTHCAGIAAGKRFGIAKAANIIAVKTIKDNGHGNGAGTIDGIDWVMAKVAETGRPSVVSNSNASGFSKAKNDAVDKLTAAGIHFVTAASNDSSDAKDYSPASAATALTVGWTTIEDAREYRSNYGSCVNVFAPGNKIVSCGIFADAANGIKKADSTATKSGTSMACPHVSGLVAYFIAKNGNLTPAAMVRMIQYLSLKDILTNIPDGTANRLAHNDDSPRFAHCITDGTYTIVPVQQKKKRVRVPKSTTDDNKGKSGTANSSGGKSQKEDHETALYVETPDPKATEVDKYEQWNVKRVDVPEEEKKRSKPFWTAYYTIQNVGTSKYAWSRDEVTAGGTAVMEHESPRIWGIDVVSKNQETSLDQCFIKFTNSIDKTYYWGIDEEKKDNKYTVVDDWVKLYDKPTPDHMWYFIKVPAPVKKGPNEKDKKKGPSTNSY